MSTTTDLVDDLELQSQILALDDGAHVALVRQDGCHRFVIWGAGDDPDVDEPWIVASAAPDGYIETFSDIPGRRCSHNGAAA